MMNKEKRKNINYLMGYIEAMNIINSMSKAEIEGAKREIEYNEKSKKR